MNVWFLFCPVFVVAAEVLLRKICTWASQLLLLNGFLMFEQCTFGYIIAKVYCAFCSCCFWSKSLLKLYFHFIIWHLNSARLFYNSDSPRSFPRDPLETVASPARTVYPVLRWVPVKYTHWLAQYLMKRLLRVRKLEFFFPPHFACLPREPERKSQ